MLVMFGPPEVVMNKACLELLEGLFLCLSG